MIFLMATWSGRRLNKSLSSNDALSPWPTRSCAWVWIWQTTNEVEKRGKLVCECRTPSKGGKKVNANTKKHEVSGNCLTHIFKPHTHFHAIYERLSSTVDYIFLFHHILYRFLPTLIMSP